MKNIDWRDIVIIIMLGLISIMAFFTLVDWTIEKDNIVGVGNIVTFVGAIIGGLITLLGVNKTIRENRRLDLEKILPGRIVETQKIIESFENRVIFLKSNKMVFKDTVIKTDLNKFDFIEKLGIYKESHVKLKEYLTSTNGFPFEKVDFKLYEAIMNFRERLSLQLGNNSIELANKEYLMDTNSFNEQETILFFEEATNGYIELFDEFVEVAKKVKIDMISEYKKY